MSKIETVKGRTIRWRTYIPDPLEDEEDIGDSLELQVLAESDGRLISGHWEMSGTEWLTVVFIPDWLCKDIISADEIEYWCFAREIR